MPLKTSNLSRRRWRSACSRYPRGSWRGRDDRHTRGGRRRRNGKERILPEMLDEMASCRPPSVVMRWSEKDLFEVELLEPLLDERRASPATPRQVAPLRARLGVVVAALRRAVRLAPEDLLLRTAEAELAAAATGVAGRIRADRAACAGDRVDPTTSLI